MKNKIVILCVLFLSSYSCSKAPKEERVWFESFQTISSMNIQRTGAAGIVSNGHLYIFGGVDGNDFLQSTERAKINQDGSLGEWVESAPLNIKRGFFYAIEHNGFVYAIGGGNGPNGKNLLSSVERTKINPDGTLQPWVVEPELMLSVRRCSKAVLINGAIYAVGGYNGGFLEYVDRTTINPDGSLAVWTLDENPTTAGRYINGLAKKGNNIYVVGGHHETKGTGLDDVEWTTVNADGSLKKWQKGSSTLLQRRYGHSVFLENDFIYAVGGVDGMLYQKSIEIAKVKENGEIGKWEFAAPLSIKRESTVSLINNNILYVIGGSNMQGFLNSVERATIRNDGKIGYWVSNEEAEQRIKEKKGVMFEGALIPTDYMEEYFKEGNSYLNKNNYDMAERFYKKVIAINSDYVDAYQNLSSVYLRQKKYDDAITTLDKVIEKKKDYYRAYYNKACAYALQGETDQAISFLLAAVEHGYNDLEAVETDPDLSSIRNTLGYKKVIRAVIMKE